MMTLKEKKLSIDDDILRMVRVKEISGLSKATIYNLMKDNKFPMSFDITGTGGAVGWSRKEVEAWKCGLWEPEIAVEKAA